MKEATFSQKLIKKLRSMGIYAIKVADRFKSGIPDIYVTHGCWIESKVIPMPTRAISLIRYLTTDQMRVNTMLCMAKEPVYFAAAFTHPETGRILRYMIIPFPFLFEYTVFTPNMIEAHSHKWNGKNIGLIEQCFDVKTERHFNVDNWKRYSNTAFEEYRKKFIGGGRTIYEYRNKRGNFGLPIERSVTGNRSDCVFSDYQAPGID